MFDKKESLVVNATYILIILLVIGSMISDFHVIDILYIISVIVPIIVYKFRKSDDDYTK